MWYKYSAFCLLVAFGFMAAASQNIYDEGTYEMDQFVRYYGL